MSSLLDLQLRERVASQNGQIMQPQGAAQPDLHLVDANGESDHAQTSVIDGTRLSGHPAGKIITLTGGYRKPIEQVVVGDLMTSYDRGSSAFVGGVNQGRPVLRADQREHESNMVTVSAGGAWRPSAHWSSACSHVSIVRLVFSCT
jgi:hypothetical protein